MAQVEHRILAFTGSGAGEYPATWGQLDTWREMEQAADPAHANVVGGGFLPAGHTTNDVQAGIADLVERYQSLRTRFRLRDDGRLIQTVVRGGALDVELHELDGDPATVVPGLVNDLEVEPYDLGGGLPMRVRIETIGGEPRIVLFGMPHIAADFLSTRVLYDDFAARLHGRPGKGARGLQPAEKAAIEGSAEGRRTLRRSLDYWRGTVAGDPGACFTVVRQPAETPRYRSGVLRSRAVPRALDTLSARYRVGTSHVLLAAVAALVGRYTGRDRCLVRMVVGNRGRRNLRYAIGTLSQEAVASVNLRGGGGFEELVRAAWASSLRAMRHGEYDPDLAAAVVTEAGAELDVYFNDMWTATRSGSRGYEGDAGGGPETTFEEGASLERASVAFFFEALEVFDDPEAVSLSLLTDTVYVPSPAIREFLFAVEELLMVLAGDDRVKLDEIELGHDPGRV